MNSTQERLAALESSWARLYSCWESSSCSLQIVCALETKKPSERHRSVIPMTWVPSFPRREKRTFSAELALELIRVLHPLADERVFGVAGQRETRDLELLEHGRVLQREQALVQGVD